MNNYKDHRTALKDEQTLTTLTLCSVKSLRYINVKRCNRENKNPKSRHTITPAKKKHYNHGNRQHPLVVRSVWTTKYANRLKYWKKIMVR